MAAVRRHAAALLTACSLLVTMLVLMGGSDAPKLYGAEAAPYDSGGTRTLRNVEPRHHFNQHRGGASARQAKLSAGFGAHPSPSLLLEAEQAVRLPSAPSPTNITGASVRARLDAAFAHTCGAKFMQQLQAWEGRHTPQAEAARVTTRGNAPGVMALVWRCHEDPTSSTLTAEDDDCGGLGDRLVGIVSVLSVALLADLPFYIDWPLASAAIAPRSSYDWRLESSTAYSNRSASSRRELNAVNGRHLYRYIQPSTLRGSVSERLLSVRSNRGSISPLWRADTPATAPWRALLSSQWGLEEVSTAFGCLAHALVRPNDAVVARFGGVLGRLLAAQAAGTAIIGIHVRVGDAAMREGAGDGNDEEAGLILLDTHHASFSSATRIERMLPRGDNSVGVGGTATSSSGAGSSGSSVRGGPPRALWLLVSDSAALKRAAAAKYGSKLVVTDVAPLHVSKRDGEGRRALSHTRHTSVSASLAEGLTPASATTSTSAGYLVPTSTTAATALVEGFGEWWLLSQSDYFVLGVKSAFGRTAVCYSLRGGGAVIEPPANGHPGLRPLRSLWSGDPEESELRGV